MQSILADLMDGCSWPCHWDQPRQPQHEIFNFQRGTQSMLKPGWADLQVLTFIS